MEEWRKYFMELLDGKEEKVIRLRKEQKSSKRREK